MCFCFHQPQCIGGGVAWRGRAPVRSQGIQACQGQWGSWNLSWIWIGWVVAEKIHFLCSDGLVSMVDPYFFSGWEGNYASMWNIWHFKQCHGMQEGCPNSVTLLKNLTALLWSQSQMQWHLVGVFYELDNWWGKVGQDCEESDIGKMLKVAVYSIRQRDFT